MTQPSDGQREIEVLLVEDDPGDVLMTREAFEDYKVHNQLHVVAANVRGTSVQIERADRSGGGRRKADPLIHPQCGQGQALQQHRTHHAAPPDKACFQHLHACKPFNKEKVQPGEKSA